MRYKTAAALEMAVRNAAKASPQDTNRAIAGFYFHRLLCRVSSASRSHASCLREAWGCSRGCPMRRQWIKQTSY